jgi:hypothetical protein
MDRDVCYMHLLQCSVSRLCLGCKSINIPTPCPLAHPSPSHRPSPQPHPQPHVGMTVATSSRALAQWTMWGVGQLRGALSIFPGMAQALETLTTSLR